MQTRRTFIGGMAGATLAAASGSLAQASDPTELSIGEASALIRAGRLSSTDLTRAYLARIERLNPSINAYITVTRELALQTAERRDAEVRDGRWLGPLHGIPVALKDNIDTAGIRTTAASAVLADRVPDADAVVTTRLAGAGAVLLGKLNMHEFAYGGTSAISHFGAVRNPWNTDHIPGGSSGGSAAAVAARLCAAALGTDTLASIRLPAAYCGITGFKPTHGLSSIRGIIPVSESLDHVGPMTRSVADAALVLSALAGYDALDPVSISAGLPRFPSAMRQSTGQLRVGLARKPYFDDLAPDVEKAVGSAVRTIAVLSAGLRDVTLPPFPDFPPLLAEAHAWHAPLLAVQSNHAKYDPVTLERIQAAGTFSTDDFVEARRSLVLARRAIATTFEDIDVLVTPTAPRLPETIESAINPAEATGAEPSIRNTVPFNIFGIPTISVPCGFSAAGLPVGLQISGPRLGEMNVLALAHAYQLRRDWHLRTPPAAA